MPDEPLSNERQISGDDILSEILRNSEAGQFPIRRMVVLPSVYHVYLHPADFDLIRPVIPALKSEARSALIERADELNRKAQPSAMAKMLRLEAGRPLEYKILDPDWTVEFHPDAEEKLGRGDIEVFSELASAARPEFEGAMTRHVTRRRADGEQSSFPADLHSADTLQTPRAAVSPDAVYGWLRYRENDVEQVFAITRALTVIGRGGKAFWVDVRLPAVPDVSREHCRIRRDPATGRFYLKDVSQFGTSINGLPVPPSLKEGKDANLEAELPKRATIGLAGVFHLEFESADPK